MGQAIHCCCSQTECQPTWQTSLVSSSEPCLHPSAVIGFTHCTFHPVVCVWMTMLSELRRYCISKPGCHICVPHQCPCGAKIFRRHSRSRLQMQCRQNNSPPRLERPRAATAGRALGRDNVPAAQELIDLQRSDGKRSDESTQIPWQTGKCMTWDVTVTDCVVSTNCHVINRWCCHWRRSRTERVEIPVVSSHPHLHSTGFWNAQTHQFKGTNIYEWINEWMKTFIGRN